MIIKPINNTVNNMNFNGKLKPVPKVKKPIVNELTVPVIMGTLTEQLLKERAMCSETALNKGYLNNKLTKDEITRGQKLAACFNFYKEQEQVLFNIMTIITREKNYINDHFFIKKFFEFIESDFSFKTKNTIFNTLSKPDCSELLQTTLTNFATYTNESDDLQPRFTIADISALRDIYSRAKNKELILDMIKEGIIVDNNNIKAYRFNINDIKKLNKCYIDTPNKELFMTLISQYEYDESIDENCPLYDSDMILYLIKNCISKNKADFLTTVCSEKIINNGKQENRFKGDDIFMLNKIYDDYPDEIDFLIKQKIKNRNGSEIPRFNIKEIITLINKYDKIGKPLIKIIKETNEGNVFNFSTIMYLINRIETQQSSIKTKNKKNIN